ncbi:hypothetical protein KIH23_04485 [Flavobacterium sp. CYK-55]|uniref:hypothetical protein n=1 Tax=Flavobacterium sp. CYK-55 TaxID=2835529 RepID=UPI001BCAA113|nr:hypothetical protein [Flavobacterium sp. CYK-55]MBS7786547.1 hypothetical protein [Flavobacterium sp. CYK-55]
MKKTIYFLVFWAMPFSLSAQGCSDAGICNFDSSISVDSLATHSLEFSPQIAEGAAGVIYFAPAITYKRQFHKGYSFSSRITYNQVHGELGTRGQFGDVYLTGGYEWSTQKHQLWNLSVGFKAPLSAANLKINGYSLPMDYQPSLGTFDVLLGLSYERNNWRFSSGLQWPFLNKNRNSYFKEYSPTDDFESTNLFERKPDALLKMAYKLIRRSSFQLQPSLLAIYHLGEDSYENIYGRRVSIDGSSGLTLNGVLSASWKWSPKQSIELVAATPFVVRDSRPDGLTRAWVVSVNYQIQLK